MIAARWNVGLGLLAVVLVGCQPANSVKPVIDDREQLIFLREDALASLSGFTVRGGLGIWTDDETISARMAWREAADNSVSLTLVAPLGLGTVELQRDDRGAILTRGNKVIGQGASADQVLQQGLALERPIPLEQMSQWLRGLPGAGQKIQRDDRGRLKSLQYRDSGGLNWRAQFLKYTDLDGLDVPALIFANGGPYNVRLKLRDWLLASSEQISTQESTRESSQDSSQEPTNNGKLPQRLAIPGQ